MDLYSKPRGNYQQSFIIRNWLLLLFLKSAVKTQEHGFHDVLTQQQLHLTVLWSGLRLLTQQHVHAHTHTHPHTTKMTTLFCLSKFQKKKKINIQVTLHFSGVIFRIVSGTPHLTDWGPPSSPVLGRCHISGGYSEVGYLHVL